MKFINVSLQMVLHPEVLKLYTYNEIKNKKFSLVSIDSTKELIPNDSRIPNYEKLSNILYLKFDDISKPTDGYIIFNENMAKEIYNFILNEKEKEIELFIVNCTAGISRSAAICAALCKYYNSDDSYYFKNFCPNMLVYSIMLKELGYRL